MGKWQIAQKQGGLKPARPGEQAFTSQIPYDIHRAFWDWLRYGSPLANNLVKKGDEPWFRSSYAITMSIRR